MYSLCVFFVQLAPGAIALSLYQHLHTKLEIQQKALDTRLLLCSGMEEKQNALIDEIVLKYDKRTTILRDKVAQLEKEVEYLDGVERRVAVVFRACAVTLGTFVTIFCIIRH